MVLFNPKTKTLYKRNDKFKVIPNRFNLNDQRFGFVNKWLLTEKMDGTSVILSVHNGVDGGFSIHGRTAKSQFTPAMAEFLNDAASDALFSLADHSVYQADIYAELFGEGIQGNPHGMEGMHLRVFDVRIGGYWLDWYNVRDVASKASMDTVPSLGFCDIDVATEFVKHCQNATVGSTGYVEGVVARTEDYLYDNQGNRLTWKLKVRDFA